MKIEIITSTRVKPVSADVGAPHQNPLVQAVPLYSNHSVRPVARTISTARVSRFHLAVPSSTARVDVT